MSKEVFIVDGSRTPMGTKPLGAVLNQSTNLKRSAFELLSLPPASFSEVFSEKMAKHQGKELCWARRSLFSHGKEKILVCETFLPNCPYLCK